MRRGMVVMHAPLFSLILALAAGCAVAAGAGHALHWVQHDMIIDRYCRAIDGNQTVLEVLRCIPHRQY